MNILNPLHYIAANNTSSVYNLLVSKYQMPSPQTDEAFFNTIDYAANTYGEPFINDMIALHPDLGLILEQQRYSNVVDDAYKTRTSALIPLQIETEIAALNAELTANAGMDEATRGNILDKINFLRELLKTKKETIAQPTSDTNKTNQYLLYLLVAVALMFAGSKLFKNQ